MNIFGSLGSLERLLGFHLARHNVLSSNLSNAETPGYKPRDLVFEESLAEADTLASTNRGHIRPGERAGTIEIQEDVTGMDDNGVGLERQMAKLATNRLRYEAGVEIARRRIGLLRYAATDGGQG